MTWTYDQGTGELSHDGEMIATGYSGNGTSLNNPADQAIQYHGPLPRGSYTIGQPIANGGHLGPYVLQLTPSPVNNIRAQRFFHTRRCHWEASPLPASDGCIILDRPTRTLIAQSGDSMLVVKGQWYRRPQATQAARRLATLPPRVNGPSCRVPSLSGSRVHANTEMRRIPVTRKEMARRGTPRSI